MEKSLLNLTNNIAAFLYLKSMNEDGEVIFDYADNKLSVEKVREEIIKNLREIKGILCQFENGEFVSEELYGRNVAYFKTRVKLKNVNPL